MKKYSMRKLLALIGCMVLIAAMALTTTGCGSKEPAATEPAVTEPVATEPAATPTEAAPAEDGVTVMGEGATAFDFSIVDLEGNETKFRIQTDETTVGAALMNLGLIEGEEGPYGLYVMKVGGISAIYEEDGTYWAFYENGEYGLTGVDLTEIDPAVSYSFVQTKG